MMRLALLTFTAGLLGVAACTPSSTTADRSAASAAEPAIAPSPSSPSSPPPLAAPEPEFVASERVRDVMRAKLTHAHVLLDAMTLADYPRIEQNAMELAWLSRLAAWRVHDSDEYRRYSEQFQAAVELIAARARVENLAGVRLAHAQMTASCTECHAYLRHEGLVPEMPGAVSRIDVPHATESSAP